jgi:hypothetical protein
MNANANADSDIDIKTFKYDYSLPNECLSLDYPRVFVALMKIK